MTKTCGKCGHAALDDQAQFCNRCGAEVPEERRPAFPVCPGCGAVVSDELAQFCNRCGGRIQAGPVICISCGTPAIDSQSRFCTRCGTTFDHKPVARLVVCPSCGAPDPQGTSLYCNRCGAPFSRPGHPQAPVMIAPRKPAASLPVVTVPDSDWEPWNEAPATSLQEPLYPEPEQPVHHDRQVTVPQKKYDHLPLVADEMRKGGGGGGAPHQHSTEILNIPARKKTGTQKKGVLGFMKK